MELSVIAITGMYRCSLHCTFFALQVSLAIDSVIWRYDKSRIGRSLVRYI